VAVTHFQRNRFDWGPAYAAVSFNVVFNAVVQAIRSHVTFTEHVNAVRQRNVHAAANRECHAVIAFFRADVDRFRTCIQHHRAHFKVVACANATGLGTVVGIFEPVAFGIQAGRGFTHFQIQVGEVFTLFNAAAHSQCGARYSSQSGKEKDIKLFHVLCLVIKLI